MDNESVEQEVVEQIHNVLHNLYDMDSMTAGEAAHAIYFKIWEYIKDYD